VGLGETTSEIVARTSVLGHEWNGLGFIRRDPIAVGVFAAHRPSIKPDSFEELGHLSGSARNGSSLDGFFYEAERLHLVGNPPSRAPELARATVALKFICQQPAVPTSGSTYKRSK
jgi:hypothetical protein